jgi:hypothetical protein
MIDTLPATARLNINKLKEIVLMRTLRPFLQLFPANEKWLNRILYLHGNPDLF